MVCNRSIDVSFLKRADRDKYDALWAELEKQYTRGLDQYPKETIVAYIMLLNYKRQCSSVIPRRRITPATKHESDINTDEQLGIVFL